MEKTPLYDRHVDLRAKMVDFSGWSMPVQYSNVIEEHHATRNRAGLFDICHMGEIKIEGDRALDFLQLLLSRNLAAQEIGQVKLSVMTNEQGGILDDLTAYKLAENSYMLVTNAGTKDKDLEWILHQKGKHGFHDVQVTDISAATGKIDLQGPASQKILQSLTGVDLAPLMFYNFITAEVAGVGGIVSRTGYTGEDGFEIYAQNKEIGLIWDGLLEMGEKDGLKPVGLGARDTLRLEAGMMLYGHELNENTTPLEVTYGWLIDLEKEFIGAASLRKQKGAGLARKLVGFEMRERGIARSGYQVWGNGAIVGEVTSGTFSPTLNRAVGFAMVALSHATTGASLKIEIRGNKTAAEVVKLPFYKRAK